MTTSCSQDNSTRRQDAPRRGTCRHTTDTESDPEPFAFASQGMAGRFMESVQKNSSHAGIGASSRSMVSAGVGGAACTSMANAETEPNASFFSKDGPYSSSCDSRDTLKSEEDTPSYWDHECQKKASSTPGEERFSARAVLNGTDITGANSKSQQASSTATMTSQDIEDEPGKKVLSGPGAVIKMPGSTYIESIPAYTSGIKSHATPKIQTNVSDSRDRAMQKKMSSDGRETTPCPLPDSSGNEDEVPHQHTCSLSDPGFTRPGALQVPGRSASLSTNASGVSKSSVINIVAHLVTEKDNDPESQVIHAIAKKDSFWELLRHDKRTRIATGAILLIFIGLSVTLSATLSSPKPTLAEESAMRYIPVGSNIDGPDKTFPHGDGEHSKFGSSVSMSRNGQVVAIGAPHYSSTNREMKDRGLVQVFEEQDGEWALLEPSILGDADGDMAGSSVALSLDGSTLAVGSPEHNVRDTISGDSEKTGQVKVYKRINNLWQQIGREISGESANDMLGSSVGISEDGHRVAISVPGNTRGVDEKAKVYEYIDNDWVQLGDDLIGRFGGSPLSMSADGSTVAMGTLSMEENNNIGAMRVYEYANGVWRLMGSDIILKGAEGSYDTNWSPSISSDGKTIAVGSRVTNADSRIDEEYDLLVRVFHYDEEKAWDWVQLGSTLHNKTGPHLIAYVASMSADGKVLVIGDPGGFDFGINSGHSHVLRFIDDDWVHINKELDGFDSADHFGHAVSVSADGSRVSIGAPQSRATGQEVGRVSVYEVEKLTA